MKSWEKFYWRKNSRRTRSFHKISCWKCCKIHGHGRNRPINKTDWKVSKRKHQLGLQYANSNGKPVAAKKIIPKIDCRTNCKLRCTKEIGKKMQKKKIFTEFYKLDTKNKHSSVTRTTLSSFVFCLKLKKGVKYQATPTFRWKKKKLFESIKVFYFLDAGSFVGDSL